MILQVPPAAVPHAMKLPPSARMQGSKDVSLFTGSSELLAPSFAWRSGVLGTSAYFFLAYGVEGWAPKEARAVVTLIFIVHGILADLFGVPLDFTAPIAKLLHLVLNVPDPNAKTLPVKAIDADPKIVDSKKAR